MDHAEALAARGEKGHGALLIGLLFLQPKVPSNPRTNTNPKPVNGIASKVSSVLRPVVTRGPRLDPASRPVQQRKSLCPNHGLLVAR